MEYSRQFVSKSRQKAYGRSEIEGERGVPIGNLTSQIFANIYLGEFDRFVQHTIKPLGYVRYGDDFVLWLPDKAAATQARQIGTNFLRKELKVHTNPKHDHVQAAHRKLAYLGVDMWPTGRRLQKRVKSRIETKLSAQNSASYQALVKHHQPERYHKRFQWEVLDSCNELW